MSTQTLTPAEQVYIDGTFVTSDDHTVKAAFVYLGEGYFGDYDEDEENDAALYRLDILAHEQFTEALDGEADIDHPGWVVPTDGTTCTNVRVEDLTFADAQRLLTLAANTVAQAIADPHQSIKGALDHLSRMSN